MAKTYLDKTGLSYFFKKIKNLIPTKTSQLSNDSGFLTSVPSQYITESELASELSPISNSLATIGNTGSLNTEYKENTVGAINEVNTKVNGLTDLIYPVGSYYETSNANFDPNTSLGGTWERTDNNELLKEVTVGGTYSIMYRVYNDGYCELFGKMPTGNVNANSSKYTTITLPLSFLNKNIQATNNVGGAYWTWVIVGVENATTNTIKVVFWNNTGSQAQGVSCEFRVSGYINLEENGLTPSGYKWYRTG